MFESRNTKEKLSMFADAVKLAAIDGHIASGEMRFLAKLGNDLGLSQKQVEKVLKDAGSIKFIVPKSEQDKIKHILRLINIMVVDLRIDKREMDFCTSIAVKMGLNPSFVSDIVKKFVVHLATVSKARAVPKAAIKTAARRVPPIDTSGGLNAEIEQFLRERR